MAVFFGVSGALRDGKPRIPGESGIHGRAFAKIEDRAPAGFDAARAGATRAQTCHQPQAFQILFRIHRVGYRTLETGRDCDSRPSRPKDFLREMAELETRL